MSVNKHDDSKCTNCDADFLSEIYRGAKMGADAIDTLIEKVDDSEMKNELTAERKKYRDFENRAKKAMEKRNFELNSEGKMQEIMSQMGLRMNTVIDKTSSHIADILIQGNSMGIVGITKVENRHESTDDELLDMADELVKMQQNNIERLKPFLQ